MHPFAARAYIEIVTTRITYCVIRGKVRRRRLWVKGIIIQWINDALESRRRIDVDHWLIDNIGHRDVRCPIPVGHAEGLSCRLIIGALGSWICRGDLLCVVPQDLLNYSSVCSSLCQRLTYLEECKVGSVPCREKNGLMGAITLRILPTDAIPRDIWMSVNAYEKVERASAT